VLASDGRGWSPVPGSTGEYHSDIPAGVVAGDRGGAGAGDEFGERPEKKSQKS
jgi:hypothetical protein